MNSCAAPGLLVTALAFGLFSSPTVGSEFYCGQFELIGDEKTVTVIDEAPKGDSIGDIRTGIMDFIDPRTDEVIKYYFRAQIFAIGADGVHTFQGDHTWAFPSGDLLFTRDIYRRTNDTRPRGIGELLALGVLGGTGAFARVSGTVAGEAGDTPVWSFDLDCG